MATARAVRRGGAESALARRLWGRVQDLWQRLIDRMEEEILYRRTLRELDQLSDRELQDLGLARSDLPFIARRAARKRS